MYLHVGFILEACKPMTAAWGQSLKPGTLKFKQVGTASVLLAVIQRACSWYSSGLIQFLH